MKKGEMQFDLLAAEAIGPTMETQKKDKKGSQGANRILDFKKASRKGEKRS